MLAALHALANGDEENAMVALTPGGIEAQERAGQISFVANESLPITCNGCAREQIEAMGVQYGEPIDDLFVSVKLPDGWQKVATDHAMWSNLLDDKGRERASIFYKAAFYDRSAHISLARRFTAGSFPVGGYNSPGYDYDTTPIYGAVTDGDDVIWHTDETLTRPLRNEGNPAMLTFFGRKDELGRQAVAWLDEHYPDWRNPLAYWEAENA